MDSATLQDAAIVSADEAVNGNGAMDSAASESSGAQVEPQEEDLKGTELIGVLEALLFVSTEPVPVSRLATVIGTVSKSEVEQALKALEQELAREGRGIQLVKLAGGYRDEI